MKITYAQRTTQCNLCFEKILKGTQRLDDTIRHDGNQIRRLHYHSDCYVAHIQNWVENHPPTNTQGHGGRLQLDLPPECLLRRGQLISNLNALKRYYFPKNGTPKIDLQGNVWTLDVRTLKRAQRYVQRYDRIVKELEDLGGLPPSHGGRGVQIDGDKEAEPML